MPTEAQTDTKSAILDAAEQLFAEEGFDGASLRAITARAGVNLAAVNYHFHSKESLIAAVFARRLKPINEARLQLLDAIEAAHPAGPLPVEAVADAFIRPILVTGHGFPLMRSLLGRMYTDQSELARRIFREQIGEILKRFSVAFARALPHLSHEEIVWRVFFTIGVVANALGGEQFIRVVSNGLCDPSDEQATLRRILQFVTAGLKANA
ncbi:MAG: TetR/AcrR family transcriptional regulator [Bryobacteraceae bacterium]|nr:TetR/AcrR family transcriptional regulator [Bryobacteraceae bacterium]